MSEGEEPTEVPQPQPRRPHSAQYYRRLLMMGNGPQWRQLMTDIKVNYEIAYRVAEAVSQLRPEYGTIQRLWKSAVETAQPGIKISIGRGVDEDLKVRRLKQTRYSD